MSLTISAHKFATVWLPALAASAALPEVPLPERWIVELAGVPVPLPTALIALAGVLLARPLAHRAELKRGWPAFALVTAIMLIVVELWVVEAQPGWLFTFVVAIGLGFAGYSLIEVLGEQAKGLLTGLFGTIPLIKQAIEAVVDLLRSFISKRNTKDGDAPQDGPE